MNAVFCLLTATAWRQYGNKEMQPIHIKPRWGRHYMVLTFWQPPKFYFFNFSLMKS